MVSPISFAHISCLGTESSQDVLIARLIPFIQEVATKFEDFCDLKKTVMTAVKKHKLAPYFYIETDTLEDSFCLKKTYLFPEQNQLKYLQFMNRNSGENIKFKLQDEKLLPKIHNLLYQCSAGIYSKNQISTILEEPLQNLFKNLLELGMVEQKKIEKLNFAPPETPGVFRLQHASVLYRTKTTGILVDPHLHSNYEMSVDNLHTNIRRSDIQGKVDAILISHFHSDHWHLPTLMMFPPEIPIVVPKVPRASLLCDDMQQRLYSLGFKNVIVADWYSEPLIIGDIEVNVLPFYGEQPLRYEHPQHPDLRSWGNTYLLRTEYYTSWFLIDSGNDAMGTMVEVATYVRNKFGTVDFLLSNLREFHLCTPFYITGGSYWLSLSPRQMRDFPSMKNHCITLGSEGVAEIARIIGARYYLPYAHWWNCLGQRGEEELSLLDRLEQVIKDLGCSTAIVPWRIGDGFVSIGVGQFDIASI